MAVLFAIHSIWCIFTFFWFCMGKRNDPLSNDAGPTVRTNSGLIAGKYESFLDKDITVFLGIPFAEPPIGDLRFKKPVPIKAWSGTYEAISKSSPCIQYSSRNYSWIATSKQTENCLHLNIWTPGKCCTHERNLPVMVWIHGGGFYSGSSDMDLYDGSAIASNGNVIVASMNYRVGLFGFLGGGTEEAPGNVGLQDQTLALKWIRENIENFGGDMNKITLFGESAGSIAIGFHLVSPLSKGLFHRVIMESGGPYNPIFSDDITVNKAKGNTLAQIVGCADNENNLFTNPDSVIQCLVKKDAMELSKAEDSIRQFLPFYFAPMHGDDFMPKSPIAAFENKEFVDVDVMIGNNQNEGAIMLNFVMPQLFPLLENPQIGAALGKQILHGLFQNVTNPPPETIVSFYMQNITDESDSKAVVGALVDAYSDFIFVCSSSLFAEQMNNIYYYWMTHYSEKYPWAEWISPTHFEEVAYVFGIPIKDTENYTAEDSRFSSDVIQKWVSFAKHGNPLEESSNEEWPKFSADDPRLFELNPKNHNILTHPRLAGCNFWRPYFINSSR